MTTSSEKQVEKGSHVKLVRPTCAMELCAAAMQTLSSDDEALPSVHVIFQAAATMLSGGALGGGGLIDDRIPVPRWLTTIEIEAPDAS